ncbi:hypothetical protein C1S80_12280 [Mycolicibacterium aubagnense]|nr:hypothetical protein C1S80_12280 [Mycolicibacterium aubagnense]
MGAIERDAVVLPKASGGDDEYLHIVSTWEWLIGDVLRLRVPRSFCGIVLIQDPDRRPTQFTEPICPVCEQMRQAR